MELPYGAMRPQDEIHSEQTFSEDLWGGQMCIMYINPHSTRRQILKSSRKAASTHQATPQPEQSSTGKLRHPHALLLHETKADITLQAAREWRAVAPYNKSNTSKKPGPPSDRCFYPHIRIQPRRLLSLPPASTLVSCSAYSTLKIEAICSSGTSVDFQRTTRRHIPPRR
jgi:hypothetical protein